MEETNYNPDGTLAGKATYAYDAKGNQTEIVAYLADGTPAVKGVYAYDAKGNQVEEVVYNADGSLDHKTIYAYDTKGNRVEEAWYRADGILSIGGAVNRHLRQTWTRGLGQPIAGGPLGQVGGYEHWLFGLPHSPNAGGQWGKQ